MLSVEADILAFDVDSLRLLRGYREAGLSARAERAKSAAEEVAVAKSLAPEAAEQPALSLVADEAEPAAATVEADAAASPPQAPSKFEQDKSDPWVDRISDLEHVEPERLCELHGKLIAAGFINFQIRNRQTGIEYRIANPGKQFLTRAVAEANELADAREDDEEALTDASVDLHNEPTTSAVASATIDE